MVAVKARTWTRVFQQVVISELWSNQISCQLIAHLLQTSSILNVQFLEKHLFLVENETNGNE